MTHHFGETPLRTAATRLPLGNVLSSRGSEAKIGILKGLPGGHKRATIGKFIAIDCGSHAVIGVITEIMTPDLSLSKIADYEAVARIDLVGEIERKPNEPAEFQRGVRRYPAIGDIVSTISADDLTLIYSPDAPSALKLGQLHQDSGISVTADAQSLVSRHFAVLGSTGVGKSSGITIILNELLRARPEVRMLLLDVHNEYGNSFGDKASVVSSDNLRLPFWLLNFEEISDVIFGGKPSVPEELEILAELIPAAKAMYKGYKGNADRNLIARRHINGSGFTPDTPVPYLIQDLVGLIDERMGKLENRATRMVHNRLMHRIEGIRNDPRYAFMFENANVGGDIMIEVLNQLFRLDSEAAGITVLKLASLPHEVVDAVVCVVTRLAFEFGIWSDGGIPILLVCEEAHRYASRDHTVGFAPVRNAISRVAKEGRKYGVFLGLVTQRPAEIDPTIISQCSTLFFMRMANGEDQSILRSAMSDSGNSLLYFIPALGQREVIGIGEAMPLPARFSFRELPSEMRLGSDAGRRLAKSEGGETRAALVARAIERWRHATTNTSRESPDSAPQIGQSAASQSSILKRDLRTLGDDSQAVAQTLRQRHLAQGQ